MATCPCQGLATPKFGKQGAHTKALLKYVDNERTSSIPALAFTPRLYVNFRYSIYVPASLELHLPSAARHQPPCSF